MQTETLPLPALIDTDWRWQWRIDGLTDCALLEYDSKVIRFQHVCDRGDRGVIICAPKLDARHHVSLDLGAHYAGPIELSVSPSIQCPDCGTHGFIERNVWRSA